MQNHCCPGESRRARLHAWQRWAGKCTGRNPAKLDLIANEILLEKAAASGALAAIASEEMAQIHLIPDGGAQRAYLLLCDPLDGSSNIDVNVSIGTIFSVLRCPRGEPLTER